MMYAPYLSNLYYANYKDFSRGFQISSNFSIKLHLCNIFMGLNPRWKYPRHGTMLCFFFIPLSISWFSCITQQKSTEMYWFSCSYLKYLFRQHRQPVAPWFILCHNSSTDQMYAHTPWPQCKTKGPTGDAINSF